VFNYYDLRKNSFFTRSQAGEMKLGLLFRLSLLPSRNYLKKQG